MTLPSHGCQSNRRLSLYQLQKPSTLLSPTQLKRQSSSTTFSPNSLVLLHSHSTYTMTINLLYPLYMLNLVNSIPEQNILTYNTTLSARKSGMACLTSLIVPLTRWLLTSLQSPCSPTSLNPSFAHWD